MSSIGVVLTRGAIAGAAATTALNVATFLDMAIRGRPASSTPQQTVARGLALGGVAVPGADEHREARESALGSLLGAAAGTSAGVALAVLRAAGWPRGRAATVATGWTLAMLVGNGPMTVLGVTDPRTWTPTDWAADVIPHLAYAVVVAGALEALSPGWQARPYHRAEA